jgi:aspartyl-tRNA(Asn)/glutamyl-tRNA(Gln) amidotransferase subunit B
MKYKPVIGLEVHLQVKTNSKAFCNCSSDYFGAEPNTHTCPVCLGLPGALPVVNKRAIEKCIQLALALNCNINKHTKFDRKNYFYPDLPKGYQISQYDLPIGYEGYVEIEVEGDSRRIRITRVHQEEDTGKTINEGNEMLLDFNKSGIPLIEIVTEPDFDSIAEVTAFAKRMRQIVRYMDISNADMEKGQMRFELNISLKDPAVKELPNYKIEVKNIGSISVLEKVIIKEIERQEKLLNEGKTPVQETRGLKDMSGETVSQRIKEGSEDYRYFPEPDIPPLDFTDEYIEEIKKAIPELPAERKLRYTKEFGLDPKEVDVLIAKKEAAFFFEDDIKGVDNETARKIAKWHIGELRNLMTKNKVKYKDLKIKSGYIPELVKLINDGKISGSMAKQVIEKSFETGKSPELIAKEENLTVISDDSAIEEIAKKVIANNPKVVDDYKRKNENAIKFLVGQVMRETRGAANPNTAESILKKLLD